MATEKEIRKHAKVVTQFIMRQSKVEKMEEREVLKSALFLVEALLIDVHRIAGGDHELR